MPLCTDYPSTLDCFSYILLGYPDWPGNKTTTLDSVFADIDAGVEAIAARTENPDALVLLERCRTEIAETFALFKQKNELQAFKHIRQAKATFVAAGRLWKRERVKVGARRG